MKHTPTPWVVDDRHVHPAKGLTYPPGVEPETDVIVLVDTDQHRNALLNETDKANLRRIVHCVNLHDELVGAIDHVLAASEDGGTFNDVDFALLRRALAKAKEVA